MSTRKPLSSDVAVHAEEIDKLTAALASRTLRTSILAAVAEMSAARLGVILFSASICHLDSLELERIYSSKPDTYPVGARESKRQTTWAQHVMRDGKVFVGEGSLAMAAAFDDQGRMEALGVHSIINVPIVLAGRSTGVINFGRASDRVSAEELVFARLLGVAAVAAFVEVSPP